MFSIVCSTYSDALLWCWYLLLAIVGSVHYVLKKTNKIDSSLMEQNQLGVIEWKDC